MQVASNSNLTLKLPPIQKTVVTIQEATHSIIQYIHFSNLIYHVVLWFPFFPKSFGEAFSLPGGLQLYEKTGCLLMFIDLLRAPQI